VKVATVERKLAALARRPHGVVTRRELLRAGISAKQMERRLRAGALFAVFRGVYRVGHTAPSVEAHYLAAVRACGAAPTPRAAKLRAVLHRELKVTLSKPESAFLALLRSERLPLPETNRPAGGRRVDCRWPKLKLTVAWEREAHARRDQLRRYTYGDVLENPALMLAELRALLRPAPSALPSPR
jgi:hypothetical protein